MRWVYVPPGEAVAFQVLADAWQKLFGTMYRNPFITESCLHTRTPLVRNPRIGTPKHNLEAAAGEATLNLITGGEQNSKVQLVGVSRQRAP
jgi:hypothetical protein